MKIGLLLKQKKNNGWNKVCNLFVFVFFLDPFETLNRASSLTLSEKSYMHDALDKLKSCKGKSCTIKRSPTTVNVSAATNGLQRGTKRKHGKLTYTI